MTSSPNNLIWIDLEMTGLDTDNDYIIEVATIVTDSELNILAEGPSIAVHQAEQTLDAMDEWNTRQHNKSGLEKDLRGFVSGNHEGEGGLFGWCTPRNRSVKKHVNSGVKGWGGGFDLNQDLRLRIEEIEARLEVAREAGRELDEQARARIKELTADGVMAVDPEGKDVLIPCDSIILANLAPDRELQFDKGDVYTIGDAVVARRASAAIHDGYRLAMAL